MAVAPTKNGSRVNVKSSESLSVNISSILKFSSTMSPVFSTVIVYSTKSPNPSTPSPLSLITYVFATSKLAIVEIVEDTVLLSSEILSPVGVVAVADAVLDNPPALIAC